MGFGIYINNCDTGDFHCGYFINKEYQYYRTLEAGTIAAVISHLKVYLNDSIDISWDELDKALDEAYSKIGKPNINEQYHQETSNGYVDILADYGFAENVEQAKKELRMIAPQASMYGKRVKIK